MRYNRTQASRSIYATCAFAILVGWPLWLKIMTLSIITEKNGHRPWKPYASVEFVGTGLGSDTNCHTCLGYGSSVSWPIQVKVHNTTAKAQGGQYVITYTADKWTGPWYQSSLPSILNTINNVTQVMDVCKVPKQFTGAPTPAPTHGPPTPVTTTAGKQRQLLSEEDSEEEEEEDWSPEVQLEQELQRNEERRLRSSTDQISIDDITDATIEDIEILDCCHGRPGPVYVVACVVETFSEVRRTKGKFTHGPPFDDRCVAVAGTCGASCGTQVQQPSHCVDNKIPDYYLIEDKCNDDDVYNDKKGHHSSCGPKTEDDFEQLFKIPKKDVFTVGGLKLYFTQTPRVWHWFFMCMMFMSYVSISVASIPGAGVCGSAKERLPILHTLDQNGAIKDGVKCISFSISASEHKIWVLRNLIGKIASSFLHPSARLFDYFQDEGSRAGAFALWDALVYFMHVPQGIKEDTVGLCKMWASRLRDPAETLGHNLDTFKKDSEAKGASMADIERDLDAFEDIHQSCSKFNVPEERLSMLHYAYELYELIECLGDRSVWTGWDVQVGSKQEQAMKLAFDPDHSTTPTTNTATGTGVGFEGGRIRRTSTDDGSVGGGLASSDSHLTTSRGVRAAAFAEAQAQREGSGSIASQTEGGGGGGTTRHLDGFRDWLHHPVMSSFCLQWAHSLCDVAYAAKKQPKTLDPFSDEVLGFARKDEVALKCAQQLHLFSPETKLGDAKNSGKSGGRFMEAYQNFKKTTGQLLYDFIDEREITMGTYRGNFTWIPTTLIYSTRAKPERRDKDAIKKRNLQPGIYACLNGDIELPSYPKNLTKWEGQRRCYGKVREILADRNVDGRRVRFVELSHLSEDMIANKEYLESLYSEDQEAKQLWAPTSAINHRHQQQGLEEGGEGDVNKSLLTMSSNPDLQDHPTSSTGAGQLKLTSSAFIQVPISILAPLLRCRGKAGGMNFAVKVLEEREYEKAAYDPNHHVPSLTLFAIFDCRHMVTPGFWEQTILHFFRERAGEVQLQPSVKYCQVPQNFIGVELATDYLDMQNEYLFRYVNCQRDGVGAVTSCGTNCVWAIERGFEYEEKTMIEDTATSHKVILQGYEGTYHYEKLIFGTPKDNKDFLAAVFRWSRGAVQLFWLAVFGGRSEGSAGVPFFWLVLCLMILPMAITVFGMLSAEGDGVESFYFSMGLYGCFLTITSIIWFFVMNRKFGYILRYVVLFDNSTYFFNTFPAYFWCLVLPGYMCNAGEIPFEYSLIVVASGGLLWEILGWILILEVKGWSIVEGKRPKDISILRSQQMYFVNCPLHGVAFYSGSKSAYRIITGHHDASSWSSFGHGGPGDWIVKWLIFLVSFEIVCISSAIIQLGIGGIDDSARVTSFGVGIVTAMIFLALVFDPFCILISGKARTVTLKHAYFVFWTVMLVLGIIVFGSGFMIIMQGFKS